MNPIYVVVDKTNSFKRMKLNYPDVLLTRIRVRVCSIFDSTGDRIAQYAYKQVGNAVARLRFWPFRSFSSHGNSLQQRETNVCQRDGPVRLRLTSNTMTPAAWANSLSLLFRFNSV